MAFIDPVAYNSLFTHVFDNTPASLTLVSNIDTYNIFDFKSTSQTVDLPDPATTITSWNNVFQYRGSGSLLITPAAGTIDGNPSLTLLPNEIIQLVSDGVSDYKTLTKLTAVTNKIENFPTTGITDGTFTKQIISAFTGVLNFNTGQYALMKARIAKDYVAGTAFNFKIYYAPNTTTAGNFTWTLNYQFLQPTQIIAGSILNVSGSQASSAVINQEQVFSLKIPNSTALDTDTVLGLQLVATAVPGGTRALVTHLSLSYASDLFAV